MSKLAAFLLLSLLAGSSHIIHVVVSPNRTSITVPETIISQHENSPLTKLQWVWRQATQSVPAFESGTGIDQVRNELVERNLSILREWPGYLVVREGVPLIDMSGSIRESYLYGFENSELVLGPQRFGQVMRRFESAGLTAERVQVLHMFVDVNPEDPDPYNEFAWLLATHPDPDVRDPQLAIEYSTHAVNLYEVPDWEYVDTLAAAYASAGSFDNALKYQRQAIAVNGEYDADADKRLELYLNGESYVAPRSVPTADESEAEEIEPTPRAALLREAAMGSVDAQWTLARFYVQYDIKESQGVMAPAAFWLEQAAENGHEYAANELGYCYLMSVCGVAQDYVEAVRWFEIAVDSGDATAAFNLGRMMAKGHGAPRDDIEATRLLAVAANSGNDAAAFSVAFRYGEGLGAAPNFPASRRYFRQIETAGYEPADFLLDDAYFQMFHGAAAIAAALDRAAVRPDEMGDALMDIVDIFEDALAIGDDVFTVRFADETTFEYTSEYGPYLVFNLIRIAASLGATQAQLRFASLYEQGQVVPRSMIEAHYWRQRAAQ